MFEALKRTASKLDSHSFWEISCSCWTSWKGYYKYMYLFECGFESGWETHPNEYLWYRFKPIRKLTCSIGTASLLNLASHRDIAWPFTHFSPLLSFPTVSWPHLPRHLVTIFVGFIVFVFFVSFSKGHLIWQNRNTVWWLHCSKLRFGFFVRILLSWSFHIKFTKLAKGSFNKFHMNWSPV